MTVEEMRQWLLDRYPASSVWVREVRLLTTAQVVNLYTKWKPKPSE